MARVEVPWPAINPGTYLLGCARYAPPELPESAWDGFNLEAPFALWNPQVRNHIEAHVLCLLAGGLAELLLAPPRVGRQVPSVVEQAAEQVEALSALPDPAPADVAVIRKLVDTPAPTDAEWVAKLAHVAHGPDLAASSAWLRWTAARSVILARRADIERLADVAAVRRTLSGEAVAAVLILDPSPAVRAHVAIALRAHVRQLRRDGVSPPPDLASLADALMPQPASRDDLPQAPQTRAQSPGAARMARYRARKRGEPVPLRRPGPAADRHALADQATTRQAAG